MTINIVVLAGRRIDDLDVNTPRFPLKNVQLVEDRLRQFFNSVKVNEVVCSGACGADILGLKIAGELGIHRIMVLTFKTEIFKIKSVIDRPGNWGALFDTICNDLNKTNDIVILNYPEDDEQAYTKTNIEILNLAEDIFQKFEKDRKIISDADTTKKLALIIWEGSPKESDDTTLHFMEEAKVRDFEIKEISTLN